jgi:hypothetical protein
MNYRVALQSGTSPNWCWRSSPLCSLLTVVRWLMRFRIFAPERLCVFSSPTCEALDEQLRRAIEEPESSSVPATHFVPQPVSPPTVCAPATVRPPAAETGHTVPLLPASYQQPLVSNLLDQRREALEYGAGGDRDQPYRFTLPVSTPELLAWVKLLARVRNGDLRTEVAALART